jgi:hypothetical protein
MHVYGDACFKAYRCAALLPNSLYRCVCCCSDYCSNLCYVLPVLLFGSSFTFVSYEWQLRECWRGCECSVRCAVLLAIHD